MATKRALRAILKATDICAREPERAARFLVANGYAKQYDYALQAMMEMGMAYVRWRDYDPEDTMRFYALRLHEAGMIGSSPQKIIEGAGAKPSSPTSTTEDQMKQVSDFIEPDRAWQHPWLRVGHLIREIVWSRWSDVSPSAKAASVADAVPAVGVGGHFDEADEPQAPATPSRHAARPRNHRDRCADRILREVNDGRAAKGRHRRHQACLAAWRKERAAYLDP